jgi:hypothetical protein
MASHLCPLRVKIPIYCVTICIASHLKNHYALYPKDTSCGAYIEIFA